DRERLASDPWYSPANEARALRLVAGSAVPAPHLYAADLEGAVGDTPALLESWVPGVPAWRPDPLQVFLDQAATILVQIHAVRVPTDAKLPRYAPYASRPDPSAPLAKRSELWERVATALEASPPAQRETFIHRDYHPGNVLWDGGRVSGVVDWAT